MMRVLLLICVFSAKELCYAFTRTTCQNSVTNESGFNSTSNLILLRSKMKDLSFNGYIISNSDEHGSHFISERDKRLQFLSGFTGSHGLGVVLAHVNNSSSSPSAALFTDSRYSEQADKEIDCNWQLVISSNPLSSLVSWINKYSVTNRSIIASDARLLSKKSWLTINDDLERCGHRFLPQRTNLIDEMWPEIVREQEDAFPLFVHEFQFSGETWEDKVSRIIIEVEKKKANGLVISNSQDIAWITNLRSSAQFVPTFKSYIFINTTSRSLTIYLNPQRVKDEVSTHLGTDYQNCTRRFCVEIRPYNAFLEELFWIGKESSNKIFIPDDTNFASYVTVPEENRVCGISPVARLKAVKNAIEIEGMRQASIRDSIAFIESMAIISRDLVDKGTTDWDETTVSKLLSTQRKSLPNNRGDSFPAIVAVGPHAAKAHHRPNNASRTFVSRDEILLIDTGGQYLDGTTDVSRCFHFETPSDIEKEAYTRVLMGVIDLTTTKFPSGISAAHIPDAVARRHLLEAGLQYDHGTGHGIGVYLDPHENSIYIGSETGFKVDAGMITSIEPGYYEAGRFGVRIENVVLITRADVYSKPHANDNRANNNFNNSSKSREFLTFETLTLVPLEPKLIKTSLLTWKHRKWINEYNSKIRKIVGKELKRLQKFDALKWMNEKTSVIPEGDCHFTSPKRDFAKEGDLRSLSPKPSTFFSSLLYNEFWFFTSSTFLLTFLLPPLIGH